MPRTEPWTIKRVLDWTSGYLERKGDEHPRLSAEWLLANVCGLSRVELYVNFDKPLEAGELDAMHAAIERRAAGEPLQYVTGEMPFRHIVLKCERGVLIPRPETEVLVDAALEGVDAAAEKGDEEVGPVRVLEVGTGTGCIALSIASERPGTLVTATDLSPRAAELAARNREALGLEEAVDVISLDLSKPCTEVIAVLTPYGDAGNPSGVTAAYLYLMSNPGEEIWDVEGISFSGLNLKNDGVMVWDFRAAHWRLEGNLIYKAIYKEGGYQPDGVMVNGAGPWQVQGNNWEITDIDAFRNLRAQLWNAVFGAGTKLEVYGR